MFDRYLRHDELTAALHALVGERCRIDEIGRSHEGRPIWLATVTDPATGAAETKPALWVDANIHATELAGSAAALHLLHTLVHAPALADAPDDEAARVLATRTVYVVPRVNPDGAEAALADTPRLLRSSTRPWPWPDHEPDGWEVTDVDGDGCVRQIRIRDPHGAWKPHPDEPAALVRRGPTDPASAGPFYRLLPEGRLRGPLDGVTIAVPRPAAGLDLNRNYPAGWRTEGEQPGAGPYPASEPEVAAVVRAMTERPTICAVVAYHTYGGLYFRPSSSRPDAELPYGDVEEYRMLAAVLAARSGYPTYSTFEDFTPRPKDAMTGAADDWAYEHLGVFALTTELWDVVAAAGLPHPAPLRWWDDHDPADDLAIHRYLTGRFGDRYIAPWRAFDHPELGAVEIGGLDQLVGWTNPPLEALEGEIAAQTACCLHLALRSPRLVVVHAAAEAHGDDVFTVRLGLANDGWNPTQVTELAESRRLVLPLVAEIDLPAGATLLAPRGPRQELGQLAGRRHFGAVPGLARDATADRAVAAWTVRAPAGTTVGLRARHPRAGSVAATVVLGGP